jgi:hypothetical protein
VARTLSALSNILAAVLVAGCGTLNVEERLNEARQSWEGATYGEVVARWGPPARSAAPAEGSQTHTWVSQEAPVRPYGPSVGVGVFGGSGGSGVGIGVGFPFGMTVNPASCERTLTFKEGRLVEQHWTGDPGYCTYFRRDTGGS